MTTTSIDSAAKAPAKCVHHWVVEPADGPISRGRCKRCRQERTFSNSTETATEEVLKITPDYPVQSYGWR